MVTSDPAASVRPKLPAWRTTKESFGFVFGNFGQFLLVAWLPFLITFAAQIVTFYGPPVALWLLSNLIYYLAYALFAVRWHRLVLLDDRGGVFTEPLAKRNFLFFGYTLLFALAPILPILVLMLEPWWLYAQGASPQEFQQMMMPMAMWMGLLVPVVFILYLVMFRLSLLLPAAAVDRPLGFGEAWRRLGGNTWRLIGASVLVGLAFVIAIIPIELTLGLSMVKQWQVSTTQAPMMPSTMAMSLFFMAMLALGFLMMAALITVLSMTYRHVIGAPGGDDTAPVAATAS